MNILDFINVRTKEVIVRTILTIVRTIADFEVCERVYRTPHPTGRIVRYLFVIIKTERNYIQLYRNHNINEEILIVCVVCCISSIRHGSG